MKLSQKEQDELEKAKEKFPVVAKMLKELELYETDPTHIFLAEVSLMSTHLANEMKLARSGKIDQCKILNSEDKIFERVFNMIKESAKVFDGLDKGKGLVSPEDVKKASSNGLVMKQTA